jgi:chromosome segregation ATPase
MATTKEQQQAMVANVVTGKGIVKQKDVEASVDRHKMMVEGLLQKSVDTQNQLAESQKITRDLHAENRVLNLEKQALVDMLNEFAPHTEVHQFAQTEVDEINRNIAELEAQLDEERLGRAEDAKKIDELNQKIEEHEAEIAELNFIVAAQKKTIQQLKKDLRETSDRSKQQMDSAREWAQRQYTSDMQRATQVCDAHAELQEQRAARAKELTEADMNTRATEAVQTTYDSLPVHWQIEYAKTLKKGVTLKAGVKSDYGDKLRLTDIEGGGFTVSLTKRP